LFNAGLEGKARRAIDFFEGDKVDAAALKKLVQAAVAYNQRKKTVKSRGKTAENAGKAAKTG
jgi:hypothetical protein